MNKKTPNETTEGKPHPTGEQPPVDGDEVLRRQPTRPPALPISPYDSPADIVLARLLPARGSRPEWRTWCPVGTHPAKNALRLKEDVDGVLEVKCDYDCTPAQILDAIDLDPAVLVPSALAVLDTPGKPTRRPGNAVDGPLPGFDYVRFQRLLQASRTGLDRLFELSQRLNLLTTALGDIRVGFDDERQCWVFPERDSAGRVVGITYYSLDGKTSRAPGSRDGLTFPCRFDNEKRQEANLYVVEGALSTAALQMKQELVVGIPSLGVGRRARRWLVELLKSLRFLGIVIVVRASPDRKAEAEMRATVRELAQHLSVNVRDYIFCSTTNREGAYRSVAEGNWGHSSYRSWRVY